MPRPLPAAGVRRAGDDDAPLLRDVPQDAGMENGHQNAATPPSFATGFGEGRPKKRNLLKGWLGLGPPVEVVDVVVTNQGAVGELLLAFHAQRLVGQPLFPPSQTYRKGAKTFLF